MPRPNGRTKGPKKVQRMGPKGALKSQNEIGKIYRRGHLMRRLIEMRDWIEERIGKNTANY